MVDLNGHNDRGNVMPSTHHGILIHVVFSTKQRFALLHESWRDDLYAIMGGIARNHKTTLLRARGVEDHVHLLLRFHPSFSIAETIQRIKANSSNWINNQRKIDAKFSWQPGYGAFSVSQSMADTVKRYLDNQVQHHVSFGASSAVGMSLVAGSWSLPSLTLPNGVVHGTRAVVRHTLTADKIEDGKNP